MTAKGPHPLLASQDSNRFEFYNRAEINGCGFLECDNRWSAKMKAADQLFPDSPRVIYGKAPLTAVICQLRFPPILRIESTVPADFQERVRTQFPLLDRPVQIGLTPGL